MPSTNEKSLLDIAFERINFASSYQKVPHLRKHILEFLEGEVEFYDPFRDAHSVLSHWIQDAFASATYQDNLEANHIRFLHHERTMTPSAKQADVWEPITSECHSGRFSISFFLDHGEESFIVNVGRIPLFVFNARQKKLTFTSKYREKTDWILANALAHVKFKEIKNETLFGNPKTLEKRVFIIGDERLGHFMRETLGFIEKHISGSIKTFLELGGETWVIRDRCFVDPARIFPELHNSGLYYTNCRHASFNFELGSRHMHKIYRSLSTSNEYTARLQKPELRRNQSGEEDLVRALISLDVEKSRFLNQKECLSQVIEFISNEAKKSSKKALFIFDGWTGSPFLETEKDVEMISKLKSLREELTDGNSDINFIDIFGKSADRKIFHLQGCDIAVVTHGAAAYLPSKVLGTPTVTYNTYENMNNYSEVDQRFIYPVRKEYLIEDPSGKNRSKGFQPFSVIPTGIVEAISASGALTARNPL